MKFLRFRLAGMMAFVAFAALYFGGLRTFDEFVSPVPQAFLLGTLPMAIIVATAVVIGQLRPGTSPFLRGFEAFGAMALVAYAALILSSGPAALHHYFALLDEPWDKTIGGAASFLSDLISPFVLVIILGLPQLAFALIGGFLSKRYRITITRREIELPSDGPVVDRVSL